MKSKLKTPTSVDQKGVIKNNTDQSTQSSSNKKNPIFSFQYLAPSYNIKSCEKLDKAAFADQLELLGSKTWQELQQANRHGLGFEKINQDAIKPPLPTHLKGDKAVNFIAFRFSGEKPMIGYRQEEVYHIIWVDKNFSVYEH